MFEEKRFASRRVPGEYLDYLSYRPKGEGKLPLLLYIHGAGSRGSDIKKLAHVGPIGELDKGRVIPAVLLAPQCHAETWFDLYTVLCEFIETAIARDDVDPDRVYLTGSSMGGYTTWQLCISHPEWFAAAVPVCGGGMYWEAHRLKNISIWAFHGEKDGCVLPAESVKMVNAINRLGGSAKLTLYPDVGHGAWEPAFADDEMWAWLFAQKKQRDA